MFHETLVKYLFYNSKAFILGLNSKGNVYLTFFNCLADFQLTVESYY